MLSGGAIALSVIGTLMLFIMLMVLLAWIARRSGLARCTRESQAAVSLVASKPLGSRERLVMVDVGEQRLVLGVTPTHISCLTPYRLGQRCLSRRLLQRLSRHAG